MTSKRLFLLALLALLAVGVGLLVLRAQRRGPASDARAPAPEAAQGVGSPTAGAPGLRPRSYLPSPPDLPRLSTTEQRSGALEGRVVARGTSQGVPGAELVFRRGEDTVTVRSDREGGFLLEPPAPGRYELTSAVAEGFLPFAPQLGQSPVVFEARPGERVSGVVLQLEPAVPLRVLVVSPDGKPVPGAVVAASEPDGAVSLPAAQVTTDGSGEALVRVTVGVWLEATHPDFASAAGFVTARDLATGRTRLELGPRAAIESATSHIAGRVVDAAGRAEPGARVRAVRLGPETRGSVAEASTDASGGFDLTRLAEGGYVVSATAGSRRAHSPAVAGTTGLVLQLPAASATLELEVTDALSGAPVPAFAVALEEVEPSGGPPRSRVVFDTQGRLVWAELPPGPARLFVSAQGFAPAQRTIELRDGAATRVTVPLGPGGRISGTVTDGKTRRPVVGARVSIESGAPSDSAMGATAEALTSAEGRFELSAVEPGLRMIEVSATGYHLRSVSGLRVEPGQVTATDPIELTPLEAGEEAKLELAGIGCALGLQGDRLVLSSVVPGGGADLAGMVAGDAILAIEGSPVSQMRFDESIAAIRGPEGTWVRLTVLRGGDRQELDVERRKIRI